MSSLTQSAERKLGYERLDSRMWSTPLGQFVHAYGAGKLAYELKYHRSAVYHWISGSATPYPKVARRIVELASSDRFLVQVEGGSRRLSVDDVLFGQREAVDRIRVR